MNEQQLQAIRDREQAASEGPWLWTHSYQVGSRLHWCIEGAQDKGAATCRFPLVSIATDNAWRHSTDADFIAHARQDIPALLAELDLATQAIHDLQQESGNFRRGREAERGLILATLNALCESANGTLESEVLDSVANLLADNADVLHLPPDQIRAENARLRRLLQHMLDVYDGDGRPSNAAIAARKALEGCGE